MSDQWVMATRYLIVVTVLGWILWDCLVIHQGQHQATITQVLRAASADDLIIAVFVGALVGHVFWR